MATLDLNKIMQGTKHRIQTVFPFSDDIIFLRVLSEHDIQQACRFADSEYKERKAEVWNYDERNAIKTMYELYLAIVNEQGERLFPDFDTFSQVCTPEIARRLIEEQNTFQNEVHPDLSAYSEEQLEQTIEELKKKSNVIFNISDSRILKKLLHYTVLQLAKQQIGK